jgi:DNA-binding NarL/FixJ family response regulator
MAEMHRIESSGIAPSLPARGKHPNLSDMSLAWSRASWLESLPRPASAGACPDSSEPAQPATTRLLVNQTREHIMLKDARSRVLRKIASHRQKSGQPVQAALPTATSYAAPSPRRASASLVSGKRVLTPRELEVLRLVARGESDRRIAERLYLSRRTVSCHVSNILDKLDVESRRKAVLTAIRIGLL